MNVFKHASLVLCAVFVFLVSNSGLANSSCLFDKAAKQSQLADCERQCRRAYYQCIEMCADPACHESCRIDYRECLAGCSNSDLILEKHQSHTNDGREDTHDGLPIASFVQEHPGDGHNPDRIGGRQH